MQGEDQRGTLGTVRNATLLLSLLAEGPAYNQLTDLAERSGMSLPTVHRLLRSLALAGLVEQDPRSLRYSLGPEIVRLSERYLDRLPLLRTLSPYLRELRDTTKTTILVALLVRTSIVYVDRVDGEEGAGVFREAPPGPRRARDSRRPPAAGPWPLEAWAEAVDGRPRPSNRDRRLWADAPFLLLGPDGDRPMAELAVPVLDGVGQPLAALCARGDPAAFPDDRAEGRRGASARPGGAGGRSGHGRCLMSDV